MLKQVAFYPNFFCCIMAFNEKIRQPWWECTNCILCDILGKNLENLKWESISIADFILMYDLFCSHHMWYSLGKSENFDGRIFQVVQIFPLTFTFLHISYAILSLVSTDYIGRYPVWQVGTTAGLPFLIKGKVYYPEQTILYLFIIVFSWKINCGVISTQLQWNR